MHGVTHRHPHLADFWSQDRGLGWVLALLTIAIFVVAPIVHDVQIAILLFTLLFAGILLWNIHTMGVTGQIRVVSYLIVFANVAVQIVAIFWPWSTLAVVEPILGAITLILWDAVILFRVFGPGSISAHRIMGAVAAYLIAGLVFSDLYQVVEIFASGSLSLLSQPMPPTKEHFIYFSFVTLSTVGYGDILPVHPISRSLATLEALVGQLYPTIFIGRLLSLGPWTKAG
jgi:hypothetical protein